MGQSQRPHEQNTGTTLGFCNGEGKIVKLACEHAAIATFQSVCMIVVR